MGGQIRTYHIRIYIHTYIHITHTRHTHTHTHTHTQTHTQTQKTKLFQVRIPCVRTHERTNARTLGLATLNSKP